MAYLRMAAVAAPFGRDLEEDFARIAALVFDARASGVRLLALPEACLGGYLASLDGPEEQPPAFAGDGPEIRRLARLAGEMVVVAGYCEQDGDGSRYNSAVCVWLAANQSGTFGSLRFAASAKVVDPGGGCWPARGTHPGWPSRSSTSPPPWTRPGGVWATCGTGARRRTGPLP
jgi:Predicted amidohydrolase